MTALEIIGCVIVLAGFLLACGLCTAARAGDDAAEQALAERNRDWAWPRSEDLRATPASAQTASTAPLPPPHGAVGAPPSGRHA